jgi:multidrug efflux pump subunit AcrA (membrane-fusion protein)
MRSNIRWLIVIAGTLFQTTLAKLIRAREGLYVTGGALLGLALLGVLIQPWHQRRISAADMSQLGVPSVSVASPQLLLSGSGLDLPAEVRPWQEASIYSRINGYLKHWLVDIGEHVEAGQLLTEVEIPDLQQKMDQVQSQAVLAEHSLQLAKDTNTKWQQLFKQGVVRSVKPKTRPRRWRRARLTPMPFPLVSVSFNRKFPFSE